jgi:hypothetical protein
MVSLAVVGFRKGRATPDAAVIGLENQRLAEISRLRPAASENEG